MSRTLKDEKVFVRMPHTLRERIAQEARIRGEAESVVIREALRRYFDDEQETVLHDSKKALTPDGD